VAGNASRDGVTLLLSEGRRRPPGRGLTRHLTDTEVRIESDQGLPVPGGIELRIKWPFLLQSACPLELVIQGWLGESDCEQGVVSIRSYEFRTCGEHSFEPADARGVACDLIG